MMSRAATRRSRAPQFLAARGSTVEIVTPDKVVGLEMSDTNYGAHMTELYTAGVTITPDSRLAGLSRRGNRLAAEIENTYTGAPRHPRGRPGRRATTGRLPNASLYAELKPLSRNLGELDLDALARGRPQTIAGNDGRRVLPLPHRRCLGRPQHPRRHARCHARLQGFLAVEHSSRPARRSFRRPHASPGR